jgi:hypothetical protein
MIIFHVESVLIDAERKMRDEIRFSSSELSINYEMDLKNNLHSLLSEDVRYVDLIEIEHTKKKKQKFIHSTENLQNIGNKTKVSTQIESELVDQNKNDVNNLLFYGKRVVKVFFMVSFNT